MCCTRISSVRSLASFFRNEIFGTILTNFFLAMHHPISNELYEIYIMNERSTPIGMPCHTKYFVSDRLKLSSANRMTILFFNHFSLIFREKSFKIDLLPLFLRTKVLCGLSSFEFFHLIFSREFF